VTGGVSELLTPLEWIAYATTSTTYDEASRRTKNKLQRIANRSNEKP